MSTGRTAAVVVLGVLLTLTLSAGNVVFAAHATVLDPDFATNAIEEDGGYEALAAQFEEGVANQADTDGNTPDGEDAPRASSMTEFLEQEGVSEAAVTSEYVESQMGTNVRRTYAYLHGDEPRLNLTLDTEPMAENANAAADDAITNATTAELLALTDGDPLGGLPADESTIERLDEGPDAYERAREDVREEVYETVLDDAVVQTYRDESDDDLLALVIPDYDPDDYSEPKKAETVDAREDEIKGEIRTTIEDEQRAALERSVDESLDALREDVTSRDVSTAREPFDDPATDLRDATVEALTTVTHYEAYHEEADAAKADLGTAVGEYTETAVAEELGSTVDLNEAMAVPEAEPFGDSAVSTVTWFDRLALVLPLLAVGLTGLVYYLTRSVGRTLGTVGWSMLWAGVPAFLGATILAGRLPGTTGLAGNPEQTQVLTLGIVERAVGHLAAQSLAVGVLGGLFVGAAVGMRYGLLDRFRDTDPETADGEAVETQREGDPLADRSAGGGAASGDSGAGQTDSTDSGTAQHEDR